MVFSQNRIPQCSWPSSSLTIQLNILFLVEVFVVFAQTRVQQRFFGAQHVHHQDFSPGQSSTAVRRDGGPGGGPPYFVLGQSSTADVVEDLIRRSQELFEYTPDKQTNQSNTEGAALHSTKQQQNQKDTQTVPKVHSKNLPGPTHEAWK